MHLLRLGQGSEIYGLGSCKVQSRQLWENKGKGHSLGKTGKF